LSTKAKGADKDAVEDEIGMMLDLLCRQTLLAVGCAVVIQGLSEWSIASESEVYHASGREYKGKRRR
jgi:hypothetical protein